MHHDAAGPPAGSAPPSELAPAPDRPPMAIGRRLVQRLAALERFIERRDWDEGTLLMVVGGAIGAASGLAVVAFYRLIDVAHTIFIAWPVAHLPGVLRAVYWPLLTALGLWVAWLVVRRARLPDGQNVPDVQLAVAKHDAVISGHAAGVRTVASAVTLGAGGSAGSEGPVAVLGAALGSTLGRLLPIQPRHRKVLVGCGAAAGIAAAFNAPFAGAFFALEEVLGSFSVGAFGPVVIASIAGALVVRPVFGAHTIFRLPDVPDTHPLANFLLFPLLGVACGAVSALYARAYLAGPALVRRLPGPEWARPLAGGALVGAIVAASGGVLAGNGHLALPQQLFGGLAWWALLLVALGKVAATVITLSTGGSGGVFTPTLFIGAALGGGLGVLANVVLPGHPVHPHAWALVGMTGLVAGATRAPLTAIFMVYEMTDDSRYVIPLIAVAVISLATARRLAPYGLYDGWLAMRGEHLAHGVDQAVMAGVRVSAAMEREVPAVRTSAALAELLAAAAASPHAVLPVVDDDGCLTGLVSHHGVRELLVARGALEPLVLAEDLAEPVPPLRPEQSLREALAAMNARGLDALPVVDDGDGRPRLVGLLSRGAILEAYERALAYAV
ncbi:MAG: chloride channel protein [Gemmatimonadaceae bacterium]